MMKRCTKLYLKELKRFALPFVFIVLIFGSFILYIRFSDVALDSNAFKYGAGSIQDYLKVSQSVMYGIIYVLLSLFMYFSLYEEWSTKTSHQMFSLPVPRYCVMLHKYLAVLTMGLVITVLITIYNYFCELKILTLFPEKFQMTNQLYHALNWFSSIIWLMGMACVIGGVLYGIKRYHVLIGFLLFAVLFKLSGVSIPFMKKMIEPSVFGFTDTHTWTHIPGLRIYDHVVAGQEIGLINSMYPFFTGLVFLALGLYVFGKFAEV